MTVYDVFAGRRFNPKNGVVTCDLRTLPARLFAILPAGTKLPAERRRPSRVLFGPHVREIAVSPGRRRGSAQHASTGTTTCTASTSPPASHDWRNKVGHAFAFAPMRHPGGFAVQGFDVHHGRGLSPLLLGPGRHRRAAFRAVRSAEARDGLGLRGQIQEPGINSFAVVAGWELGRRGRRPRARRLGPGAARNSGPTTGGEDDSQTRPADRSRRHAPLVLDGGTTTATMRGTGRSSGRSGWPKAARSAAASCRPTARRSSSSADALGRPAVRDPRRQAGEYHRRLPPMTWPWPGRSFIVAVHGRQLKAIDPAGGLLWTYTGDDTLRHPRISPDGKQHCGRQRTGYARRPDTEGADLRRTRPAGPARASVVAQRRPAGRDVDGAS